MKTIIDKLQTLNTGIRIPTYQSTKINYSNIEKIPINYSNPNAELYQLRLVLGVNFVVSNSVPFSVANSYAVQNLKFAIYEDVLGKLDKIMYAINNYDISQALNLCEDLRRNLLTVKDE